VKVALLCPDPATTLAGIVSNPLLLARVMVAALVAALLKVTVQVLDALLAMVEGAQASEVSCAGALAVSVKACEEPFKVLVSTAVLSEVTAATVAVNVALFNPAPMLTIAGMVMFALSLESVALAALTVAAAKVTVQAEVPGAFTIRGEQLKLLICAAAARLIVDGWLWPFKVAVTMALWLLLTVPEVAVKVALPWPEAKTTLAGKASTPLLLASTTVAALVAGLFKVIVQMLDELLPRVEGVHASEVSCAGATRLMVLVRFTPPALAVTTAL
jgi:hypothetical protein